MVDLDRTLLRSNVLHEDLTAYLLAGPWRIGRVMGALRGGSAALKELVSHSTRFEPALLPYDHGLLTWLHAERRAGRMLVLATAADERRAQLIADHLGLFDEVLAISGTVNPSGASERDVLVERYGAGGYDLIGNRGGDATAWRQPGSAQPVWGLAEPIEGGRGEAVPGGASASGWSGRWPLLQSLRPHQWMKNLLVFVALFTAQDVGRASYWWRSVVMFAAFCLVASAVYVMNDMADVYSDRGHPTKRERPFASGRVDILLGWALFPALLATGVALSAVFLPLGATVVLLGYLAITVAYTLGLKRVAVVDVITLAGLYTIRIVAGAQAIDVHLTIWLLTFSIFIFTSLGIVKRVSELSRARRSGREIAGRGYSHEDLELMTSLGVTAGYVATLVFALYVNDNATVRLYRTPHLLWVAIPALLYWLSRLWLLAGRGEIDEDPLIFAAGDPVSWLVAIFVAAVFVAAKFVS